MKKFIGQNILVKSNVAKTFFNFIYETWNVLIKDITKIIFLPCASTKPIQLSRSHCYLSPITRYHQNAILKIIVSEPLGFIPYLLKNYPNYDYCPINLKGEERSLLVSRLKILRNSTPYSIKTFFIGGHHHYTLLKDANWDVYPFIPEKGFRDYSKVAFQAHKVIFSDEELHRIKFSLIRITKYNVNIDWTII